MFAKGIEMYASEELTLDAFENFDFTLHELMKVSQCAENPARLLDAGQMAGHFIVMANNYSHCLQIRDADASTEQTPLVLAMPDIHKVTAALEAWADTGSRDAVLELFELDKPSVENVAKIATCLKGMIEAALTESQSSIRERLLTETSKFETNLEAFNNDSSVEEGQKLKKVHDVLYKVVEQATKELSHCLGIQDP